jgi:hypothetical protein
MDLLPALERRVRTLAFLQRGTLGPAGGMSGGFLCGGFARQMPQVPAVPALHGARQCRADGLAVGPGPVAGDDLGPGMAAEPVRRDAGGPPFQTSTRRPVPASVRIVA